MNAWKFLICANRRLWVQDRDQELRQKKQTAGWGAASLVPGSQQGISQELGQCQEHWGVALEKLIDAK
jgi:hypothetical protein